MKAKSTQSREGVKGGTSSLFISPLQGQGTASLVGFGATPQLFLVKPTQRTRPQAALSIIYAVSRQMGATTMLGLRP